MLRYHDHDGGGSTFGPMAVEIDVLASLLPITSDHGASLSPLWVCYVPRRYPSTVECSSSDNPRAQRKGEGLHHNCVRNHMGSYDDLLSVGNSLVTSVSRSNRRYFTNFTRLWSQNLLSEVM